jgi:hypothetical protein
MTMENFIPPFREATFYGVPSCVFDKLGCAAGEKRLRNIAFDKVQCWYRTVVSFETSSIK